MSEEFFIRALKLKDEIRRGLDTDVLNHLLGKQMAGLKTRMNGDYLYVYAPISTTTFEEGMRPNEDKNVQIASFNDQVSILADDYGCNLIYPPMDEDPKVVENVNFIPSRGGDPFASVNEV
jgi:hypothetical protein